jgi:acyl-CoA thioester hydrolase
LADVLQQARDGRELFARKATVEYLAPARFDDELEIGVRCAALGRSSMRFVMEIHCGDTHLISGELVYVYAETAARKSTAIPNAWRATISALETVKPE